MKLHMNIAICIPGGPLWDSEFALNLAMMCTHILTRPMKGVRQIQFSIINRAGSDLSVLREEMLCDAVKKGCDHALMIDTDQTFPSNTLYRMLHWQRPLVACNIPVKTIPSLPTARNFNPEHVGGDVVYSDPDKHGLEEVWRVGTGIMLVDLDFLKKQPRPWFNARWEGNRRVGEDWSFCEVFEKAGIKPAIDHDLSREVGHRGTFTVTHDWVGKVVQVPEGAEV